MNEIRGIITYDLEKDEIGEHYNCIYCYVNKINDKKYIGQTNNLARRHGEHKKKGNNHLPIDKAIKHYGVNNFLLIIMKHNLETRCLLNMYEQYYIQKLNTLTKNNKGYNITEGGFCGSYWHVKTEEEKDKIKKKLRLANLGKTHSEEARRKISETQKGKTLTEEHKENLKKARKSRVGDKAPFNRGIVAKNLKTGVSMRFTSIKEASISLEQQHHIKYSRANISKICAYNHNPQAHIEKYGQASKKIGTEGKQYTFFYEEDFEETEVNKVA